MIAEVAERDQSQADGRAVLPLTARQHRLLVAVERWIEARGWPPSLSELCASMGTASKGALAEHLKALERKGYIRRDAGERRGLQVLIPSSGAVVLRATPIGKAHTCARCRGEAE
jgi:repressor LexA